MAIRTDNGDLYFNQKRSDRFVRDVWLRRLGQSPEGKGRYHLWLDKDSVSNVEGLECDARACLYRHEKTGKTISFIDDGLAFNRDCQISDVVITRIFKEPSCAGKTILSGRDFKYKGSHIVYLDTGEVVAVVDRTKSRFWAR